MPIWQNEESRAQQVRQDLPLHLRRAVVLVRAPTWQGKAREYSSGTAIDRFTCESLPSRALVMVAALATNYELDTG
jgi:hypothetical protein